MGVALDVVVLDFVLGAAADADSVFEGCGYVVFGYGCLGLQGDEDSVVGFFDAVADDFAVVTIDVDAGRGEGRIVVFGASDGEA